MKTVLEYINEAKYVGFSAEELKELEQLKQDTIDNPDFQKTLNELIKSKNNIVGYNNSKKMEYGNKYLVHFKINPLSDTKHFDKEYDRNRLSSDKTPLEDPEGFWMIGVADKFEKLYLYGRWDNNDPATLKYNSSDKTITNPKTGKSWKEKKGWMFSLNNIKYHAVRYWRDREKRGGDAFWFTDEKPSNKIWNYDCSDCLDLIYDLNNIPADIQKMLDKIEKEAIEKAKREEEDRKRKAQEEEDRKYFDMVNREYQNCGCANGWQETPEIVNTAHKDKDAQWVVVNLGRCYNKYICDKYKIYYTVDSSD